jgi:tRNA (Thr-GGU) A37 N-methylase
MDTDSQKIEYSPIGVVRSPFQEAEGTPIQPSRAKGIKGTVGVYPEYAEGLSDVDGFSDIVLLYHLHKTSGHCLKVVP